MIFGTGSIGAFYTCIIDRGGGDITCVCRSNYAGVKSGGLRIESLILGDRTSRPNVVQSVDEALSLSQQPFDFVVVCTKAIFATTPATIRLIKPAITPGLTTIVLIQNGLGVEEPYHTAFPSTPIISGVAYAPTTRLSPGVFSHSEMERLHLGLYDADRRSQAIEQLELFASLIRRGGGTTILEDDIQVERWRKIVANGTINPICALSRCRDGQLMKVAPLASDLLKNVMLEIVAVAEAAGYSNAVSAGIVETQLARSLSRPFPGVQPSMMADALDGRQLEVEAIVGRIVSIGRDKQVGIPRLETLLVLLQGLDAALQMVADRQDKSTGMLTT
jgi:2-dehydropantoate 2-reductase